MGEIGKLGAPRRVDSRAIRFAYELGKLLVGYREEMLPVLESRIRIKMHTDRIDRGQEAARYFTLEILVPRMTKRSEHPEHL